MNLILIAKEIQILTLLAAKMVFTQGVGILSLSLTAAIS
jgi:hypothetical protein